MKYLNVLFSVVSFAVLATSTQAKFNKTSAELKSWENIAKLVCYNTIDLDSKVIESGVFHLDTDDRLIDNHFLNTGYQRKIIGNNCSNGKKSKDSNLLHTVTIRKNKKHRNVDINQQLMKVRVEHPELFKIAKVVYQKNMNN